MSHSTFLTFLLLLSAIAARGQQNGAYEQYIAQYRDAAIEQMLRHNIPASITLAQGLLESAAGKSALATKGNNHFGIKCHNGWTGGTMHRDDDRANECFRVYASPYDSYEDHSLFLVKGQRYQSLFRLKHTDYKGWARGLKAAGYATNPRYAQSLIDIIEKYGLHHLDREHSYNKAMVERLRGTRPMHTITLLNGNYCVVARQGDTYEDIAKEVGAKARRLARYNERDRRAVLSEGEPVWLKKKATRGPRSWKGRTHTVQPGESMYSIAQKYGLRLRSLYKLNKLSPDYNIQVGDRLKLR